MSRLSFGVLLDHQADGRGYCRVCLLRAPCLPVMLATEIRTLEATRTTSSGETDTSPDVLAGTEEGAS